MSIEERWTAGMAQLPLVTELVCALPASEMLADLNRAEALGPVLDPTLFGRYLGSDADVLKRQLRILATAERELKALRAEFSEVAT